MTHTSQLLLFAPAMAAAVGSVLCLLGAAQGGAWHGLQAMIARLAGYLLAVTALSLLAAGAAVSKQAKSWFLALAVSAAAIGGAQYTSHVVAQSTRNRAIQSALDAGLESDCRVVFAKYEADSRLKADGYLRLLPDSDDYKALPASIRSFKPVYVTIERNPFGSDMPPNIGLCKNGFGGFAFGVRVFMNDEEFKKPFWYEEVSPSVYLWQQDI